VTNGDSGSVSVIDTASNTVVATIGVRSFPLGVAITPDGSRAYVVNRGSNNASVIDTATNTVVGTVAVGSRPFGVAITPDGSRAYVANRFSNNVSVIATATNTVVATVAVGSDPMGLAITPLASVVVEIDIKPGSFPNSINLGARGTLPVAILSSETFDATTVDPMTVKLAGAPVKLKPNGRPMASVEHVDADGRLDLVVHVEIVALQLTSADTQAVLEGKTFGGTAIRGTDSVRVVP
jgi:YVTN family beta-propeller protein